MSFINPSVSDFKLYFVRDFPYGSDMDTTVIDADITNAIAKAAININTSLFEDQDSYNIGFLYLAAHHLVMNLRASSQGISGQFHWLETSKGVSGVSTSVSIPDDILKNPAYSWLTKTNYGTEYLMMIYSQLVGNISVVSGATLP